MATKKQPEVIVSAFIFNKQNELFLMSSPKWQNQYIIPGGHLNYGEKLKNCCIRETKEETGLNIFNLKFFTYYEGINPQNYSKKGKHFVYLYFTAQTKNKPKLDKKEATEYIWLKPKNALKLKGVHPEIKFLIKKLIKNKS